MTLVLRAMDFVVQLLPIVLTSGVMFLFVSGLKQVALAHHRHSPDANHTDHNLSTGHMLAPYS